VIVPEYADVRPVARDVSEVEAPDRDASETAAVSQSASPLTTDAAVEPATVAEEPSAPTGPSAIIAFGGPDDPEKRPLLRPDDKAPQPIAQPTEAKRPLVRPYERPDLALGAQTLPLYRAEQNLFAFSPNAVAQSLRPTLRPAAFVRRAEEQRQAVARGQVCGDPAIQGEALGNVPGPGQCGVQGAVRVRSVAGVTLSSRAVMDCRTASRLKQWVVNGAKPAVGSVGGGMASIRVIGTYSCRNRNGASSGRISEHAFGHAIDIAGIGLRDGREITVLTGWNTQRDGAILRRMWQAACGPFGTVLGPEANRFHRDHFHFDTARYRSGSYCR
jgi:hypothetical protein